MNALCAAVSNISATPPNLALVLHEVDISSTKLLKRKGACKQELAVTTCRYKIDFITVYYLWVEFILRCRNEIKENERSG
jgi:hypothetical protein